ncbi:haloacid dehalogenase-like hydrolase [Mycobacteroides abscessus]
MTRAGVRLALSVLVFGCTLVGCDEGDKPAGLQSKSEASQSNCRQLDASLRWHEGVREFLQKAVDANSVCTGIAPGDARKVAIFDWDNTVVKNDIGYGTNFYMLANDLILQPPNQDWHQTSRYLTDAGATALTAACRTDVPAGKPLPTSTNIRCADEILSILDDETTTGERAFAGFDERRMTGAYAWGAALSAGYSADELAGFAAKMKEQNLAAPIGATQKVGTKERDGYIRVYPQIKDLIGTLQAHGIDTWVVSASPEPIVKTWAPEVGINADHVIGVRNVYDSAGKQTAHLAGCGGIPDGEDSVIPYIDGKRCWANQEIFGVTGPAAFDQLPAHRRQILAAGDSVTDVTFVGDATAASLVINRNKPELMCRAYDGLFSRGGTWAVNEMFIDPLPQHAPYECASAFTQSDGTKGPVLKTDGAPITSQIDSVY